MRINELREKMPEGFVLVKANLKGGTRFGWNHVYHEGRIFLTFGLAFDARYPRETFHNLVTSRFSNETGAHFMEDITENYKKNPTSAPLLKKLKLVLK